MARTFAAMVLNDLGQLLPYTCRGLISQVQEAIEDGEMPFSKEVWEAMQRKGAKIVSVEVKTLDDLTYFSDEECEELLIDLKTCADIIPSPPMEKFLKMLELRRVGK